MRVKARTTSSGPSAVLDGAEYDQTWAALVEDRGYYANYQTRTDRRIPLVRLVELRPVS